MEKGEKEKERRKKIKNEVGGEKIGERIRIKDYLTTFSLLYNCAIFRLLTELPPFECL